MKRRRSSVQDHIRARDRIPDEVLKEIFPGKLNRYETPEKVQEVADGHKDTVEKN